MLDPSGNSLPATELTEIPPRLEGHAIWFELWTVQPPGGHRTAPARITPLTVCDGPVCCLFATNRIAKKTHDAFWQRMFAGDWTGWPHVGRRLPQEALAFSRICLHATPLLAFTGDARPGFGFDSGTAHAGCRGFATATGCGRFTRKPAAG